LSSRERLLLAMNRKEPDHVPLWNLWRNVDLPFCYRDQVERAEAVLALGLDDTLLLQPPLNKTEHFDVNRVPGVRIRVSLDTTTDEDYPLLTKTYETPAGVLRQVVRRTEDWPYGADIRLFSDHNVSRAREMAVKSRDDLPRLRYLLAEPTADQLREHRAIATQLRRAASRLGVMLEGGWTALGDAALWLLGTEPLLYLQMDDPDFIEELLEIVLRWELRREALLLDEGVEAIVHSAWYECTEFWTPRTYRRLLKPRLKQLVDQAHQAGAKFSYIITTSWQALIPDLIDLGIDSLLGVDPVQGKADLDDARARLGPHMCLWGGVNGALTLGRGTPAEVHAATAEAIRILAPGGGFVLYPVDQLVKETPWENVAAMIRCWREMGGYPFRGRA
jgi:uroporphyrinogen-III decarboxylase